MEQVFIKVARYDDQGEFIKSIDKNIRDCTKEERMAYYIKNFKGKIVSILEKVGNFDENR